MISWSWTDVFSSLLERSGVRHGTRMSWDSNYRRQFYVWNIYLYHIIFIIVWRKREASRPSREDPSFFNNLITRQHIQLVDAGRRGSIVLSILTLLSSENRVSPFWNDGAECGYSSLRSTCFPNWMPSDWQLYTMPCRFPVMDRPWSSGAQLFSIVTWHATVWFRLTRQNGAISNQEPIFLFSFLRPRSIIMDGINLLWNMLTGNTWPYPVSSSTKAVFQDGLYIRYSKFKRLCIDLYPDR